MLNRQENEVMNAVYEMCDGKESCLVSPLEIMSILPKKRKYTPEEVEKILRSLELDDYFDLIESDRKGEKMYVITLHANGLAYPRTRLQMRRDIAFKVGLSVAGAVITFVVGRILVAIFSS